MPARSFIGVWILVGLVGGAVVGINFGNLGPSLVIGLIAGLVIGFVVDRFKGGSGSSPGSDGGSVLMTGDGGHHGHWHNGDDGSHGGGDAGGDGGGGGD